MRDSEDPDFFHNIVNQLTKEHVDDFYEATGGGSVKLSELSVSALAKFFIPEIAEIEMIKQRADTLVDALKRAFEHQYAICFYSENMYQHSLYEMVEKKFNELEAEEAFKIKYGVK